MEVGAPFGAFAISQNPSGVMVLFLARGLALVALGTAGLLSWMSLRGSSIPGCSLIAYGDCQHVLSSEWSRWLGMPVSIWAALIYGGIFGLSWWIGPRTDRQTQTRVWAVLVPLLVIAGGAALWFTILQIVQVRSVCIYCLVTHACGLALAVILLPRVPRAKHRDTSVWLTQIRRSTKSQPKIDKGGLSAKALMSLIGLAVAGLALMIGGQFLLQPKTYTMERVDDLATQPLTVNDVERWPGEHDLLATLDIDENSTLEETSNGKTVVFRPVVKSQRYVRILPSSDPLNVYDYPMLGDPEAKHVMVEMVAYTCPACRKMHSILKDTQERYGDQLAIVIRPVALELGCNQHVKQNHSQHKNSCRYARLAMAVALADPSKFAELHDWLMEPKDVPSLASANKFAVELVGFEVLRTALTNPTIDHNLASNHQLWHSKKTNLPALFVDMYLMQGLPKKRDFFKEIELRFEMEPIAPPKS